MGRLFERRKRQHLGKLSKETKSLCTTADRKEVFCLLEVTIIMLGGLRHNGYLSLRNVSGGAPLEIYAIHTQACR